MKIKTLLLLNFISLLLMQCSTPDPITPVTPAAAAPEAFEEKLISSNSYRNYENIVDKLYEELMANDPTLKSLEEQITTVESNSNVLKDNFSNYQHKSKTYYNDALYKTNQIKDSLLKHQMQAVLEKSAKAFESKNADISALLKRLSGNSNSINDKHLVLQLVLTLKVMENYQKSDKPQLIDYTNAVKEQSKVIQRIDSIMPEL